MPGTKKRHVELVTRLPTNRMATACWAFIVAKSSAQESHLKPENSTLQVANTNLMHTLSTCSCGFLGGNFSCPAIKQLQFSKSPKTV
jgi:hypothetical protein